MTIEHDKHKPRLAYVPMFPGFYYSQYEDAIVQVVEDTIEQYTQYFPSVDQDKVVDTVERHTNTAKMREVIGTIHARMFSLVFEEALSRCHRGSLPNGWLEFVDILSPREYNFETDRLRVRMCSEVVRLLYNVVTPRVFADVVRWRHTNAPGFISFYSNDVRSRRWSDPDEYDANQITTLMMAIIMSASYDENMLCPGRTTRPINLDIGDTLVAMNEDVEDRTMTVIHRYGWLSDGINHVAIANALAHTSEA